MTTRWKWCVAAIATAVVAVGVGTIAWFSADRPVSDCETVQQMIAYNRAHSEKIATQSDPENPTETPLSDYSSWATEMHTYASKIADKDLAARAEKAADLADRSVSIVEESRNESNQAPLSSPPPWVQKYAEIDAEFRAEVDSLRAACPA